MKGKWDLVIGGLGGVLALIFFGGISVTIKQLSFQEFTKLYGGFAEEMGVTLEQAYQLVTNLTGYFAVALFLSLIVLIIGLFFSAKDRYLPAAAILYGSAGIILLLGTQLIAFPFSFFYFTACGLLVYRMKRREAVYVHNEN